MHRVKRKGENFSSQKYDKDRTVQHKKSKTTIPNIATPAMMDKCEEYDKNKNMMM